MGSLIPKPTTAVDATRRVLPDLSDEFLCFSYRVPTAIVTSADLSVELQRSASVEDVISVFDAFERRQQWKVLHNSNEPLVSVDFSGSQYSAIVDHRWTMIAGGRLLKLVLWYDNEWGYSHRVVDLVRLLGSDGG
jgi:glyceraldehyde 3-phosphate dehydrogenase